jgi:integrase
MNDADQSAPPRHDNESTQTQPKTVNPGRLGRTPAQQPDVPTFADYVPRVEQAVGPSTRRVYGTYWKRAVGAWGPLLITAVTPLDISQLAEEIKLSVVKRRNARGGRVAAEHLIAALRCMYGHAVAEGILTEYENPAARVAKPRRLRSPRMALPGTQLEEVFQVAASTGDDPALDALLLRLHAETACRRGGALALLPEDIDPELCLIRLREKGGTVRWQPVSPTLMTHLLAHGDSRGGLDSKQPLLRYKDGRSISDRRYDYLWRRIGQHLPWVATQQVTTHWIRHTTLTWVERRFGFAVAQAYSGHEENSQGGRATATYVRAGLPEVATALAALTGEPHPLAQAAIPLPHAPS